MFQVKGIIGYLGLSDWWKHTFSKEEQNYIVNKYGKDLVNGNRTITYSFRAIFLSDLTTWFNTKKDYSITLKIINKAESEYSDEISIADRHFYFLHMIRFYYKNREIDSNLETAIKYCKAQIAISKEFIKHYEYENLPSHTGYEQLAIIKEKQGNFAEAIQICTEAKDEGWAGDRDKRLKRCNEKIGKCKVGVCE